METTISLWEQKNDYAGEKYYERTIEHDYEDSYVTFISYNRITVDGVSYHRYPTSVYVRHQFDIYPLDFFKGPAYYCSYSRSCIDCMVRKNSGIYTEDCEKAGHEPIDDVPRYI